MNCTACNTANAVDARFCGHCGTAITQDSGAPEPPAASTPESPPPEYPVETAQVQDIVDSVVNLAKSKTEDAKKWIEENKPVETTKSWVMANKKLAGIIAVAVGVVIVLVVATSGGGGGRGGIDAGQFVGTWSWQGADMIAHAFGGLSSFNATFFSDGRATGRVAMNYNTYLGFVTPFPIETWVFLETEQLLRVTGMGVEMRHIDGQWRNVPVTQSVHFRVSFDGETMTLTNVDDADTTRVVYTRN